MNAAGAVERALQDYLDERRRLGYAMHDTELHRFARYVDGCGYEGPLDAERQIAWARLHVRRTTSGTGTRRLETLRPFVRYYRQFEPSSVVVDPSLLGPSRGRLTPHIYTPDEVEALVLGAARLKRVDRLSPATYSTVFGLLAATGMRRSEALNLLDDDVDVQGRRLIIRQTKFRKSRQLPLHPTTVAVLLAYRQERDRHCPRTKAQPFFVGRTGAALGGHTLQSVFAELRRSLGWRARGEHPNPRIHDLRHYLPFLTISSNVMRAIVFRGNAQARDDIVSTPSSTPVGEGVGCEMCDQQPSGPVASAGGAAQGLSGFVCRLAECTGIWPRVYSAPGSTCSVL